MGRMVRKRLKCLVLNGTIDYMERYEQVPHTADLAVRVYGRCREELFANAANAMFGLMGESPLPREETTRHMELSAPDQESLIITWLNELLYMCEEEGLFLTEFNIDRLTDTDLAATVKGVTGKDARLCREIKAATYHDVDIREENGICTVTIVFDV